MRNLLGITEQPIPVWLHTLWCLERTHKLSQESSWELAQIKLLLLNAAATILHFFPLFTTGLFPPRWTCMTEISAHCFPFQLIFVVRKIWAAQTGDKQQERTDMEAAEILRRGKLRTTTHPEYTFLPFWQLWPCQITTLRVSTWIPSCGWRLWIQSIPHTCAYTVWQGTSPQGKFH